MKGNSFIFGVVSELQELGVHVPFGVEVLNTGAIIQCCEARVSDTSDGGIDPEAFLCLDLLVDFVLTELVVGQVTDDQSSMISMSFGEQLVTRVRVFGLLHYG